MSRIGRRAVELPKNVTVTQEESLFRVTGPRGTLSLELSPNIEVKVAGSQLVVERTSEARETRALHGLMRNLVANMVTGVTSGFERRLEIVGVGYKAEVAGGNLQLSLGYSHPVVFQIPKGIEITVDKQVKILIRGSDAQQVGQVAAVIRGFRAPDAYKAKGIRYEKEVIKVKAGKTASK